MRTLTCQVKLYALNAGAAAHGRLAGPGVSWPAMPASDHTDDPAATGAIDARVLADLAAELGDAGPALVRDLINEFLAGTPEALAALAAAVASGAAQAVRARAHRLRGQSLALGLTSLTVALRQLEAAASTEPLAGVDELLSQALDAWNEARPWLEARR
jgi:HPt (histidine-containing phosphotransfer) domain-containing protein